ncbi:SusC/RagA family protein [Bacteroides heparinolyticus]|uniref:SusC/RagA family TonB-linked outer membrane protein n=1 Tax=Prevotella heparinolytica TaxID=28113 RepID=UPI000D034E16|nr:TonB-dependent receptor [Bacteroides heparinolyticus]AVM58249.1 SusC/RagA family protein [Bacteroides heparinolyticus]
MEKHRLFLLKRTWGFLCSFFFVSTLAAQSLTVRGIVTDSGKQPVIGATIIVKNDQTLGSTTDVNGKYTLSGVARDAVLMISYVGMKSQEVPVNGRTVINIEMKEDDKLLDEVMVVAYGTAKRSAFTGSATFVNSEKLTKRSTTNVFESLAGQVAGLQMTASSGQPGSTPAIILRGIGSINAGTSPLVIVDGIPYSGGWNNINPSDVESISVLKDAASNSLYGARGANGVIIITTKQAKAGEAVVTATAKWGVNSRGTIDYDYIKDPGEYYEMHYRALYNQLMADGKLSAAEAHVKANQNMLYGTKDKGGLAYNVYSYPEGEYLIGTDGKLNPNATLGRITGDYLLYPDDWVDEAYSSSLRQEYNINVSGGTNALQLYGSFGYLKDDGILPNSNYERYSAMVKGAYQAKKWMKIGITANYSRRKVASQAESSSVTLPGYTEAIAPIYPVYLRDASGNILTNEVGKVYDYGTKESLLGINRPFQPNTSLQTAIIDLGSTTGNTLTGNAFVDIIFLKDFKFNFTAGTTVNEGRGFATSNPFYGYSAKDKGYISVSHDRTTTLNLQQLLNYSHAFGKHNVSALLGHEYYKYNYVTLSAAKKNMFSYWGNHELDGAVVDAGQASSSASDYNTEGFFFRGLYDFDNKYFFSASFRRDASSRFHPDHRWGNFYSLGAAWQMAKEEWFNLSWVDELKLKGSIGQQGNDNIGNYHYTDRYAIDNSNDELALRFSGRGTQNITWETNTNVNMGVEFSFFKHKLSGGIEYFYRKTTDMLNWFTVPLSMGYAGYYDNVGDMKNSGVELELNYTPIDTRDVRWNINMNLTAYKNRISFLPDEKKTQEVNGYQGYFNGARYYGEGLPINTWYMKRYAGVSDKGLSQWYYTDKKTGEEKTTTTYSTGDYYLCGNPNPDAFGGFGTSLSFYGFDFSMQFTYSLGGKTYDYGYASLMGNPTPDGLGYRMHKDVAKTWTPENTGSNIPRWHFNDQNTAAQSDRFLIDGSYLNFQNAQFGYTLPRSVLSHLQVSSLRVYVSADNIYYWSKRKGMDPRMSVTGVGATQTVSPVRTFSAGLTLQF